MKNLVLLTVLAAAAATSSASAQTDPCTAWTNAPRPNYCTQSNPGYAPAPVQAAPVYTTPVYNTPRYAPPMRDPLPPMPWGGEPQWNTTQWNATVSIDPNPVYSDPVYTDPIYPTPAPQWAEQYRNWNGDRVDVYINGRPVMTNVTRRDVARLRLNRPGRYEFRVVPTGYQYSQPLYTNYYDVPQSSLSLSISFGGSFNLIFR